MRVMHIIISFFTRIFKGPNIFVIYSDIKYKYVIAPVYLASFTYKGKKYDVAINGESGEVACDPPSTRRSRYILFVALFVTIAAIIFLLVCKLLLKN